jgi:hypothetical protein
VEANAGEHPNDPPVEEGGTAGPRRGRGAPLPLPLEARRAIWERIWARLLAPPTDAPAEAPPDPRGEEDR